MSTTRMQKYAAGDRRAPAQFRAVVTGATHQTLPPTYALTFLFPQDRTGICHPSLKNKNKTPEEVGIIIPTRKYQITCPRLYSR